MPRPASADRVAAPAARDHPPLRVLHVQDKCGLGGAQIQGVQRLLLWWWPELVAQGTDPAMCILRARNDASRHFDDRGIPVVHLGRGPFDPRTLFDLMSLVRDREIDVLHCHGYGATTFGRLAGLFTHTPVIVHEHWIDPKVPVYQRAADVVLSRVTARAIGVSDAVSRFLVNQRYIPKDRVQSIPNAPPLEFFINQDPGAARLDAANRLGLDPAGRYIAAVGRLHPVKGYDVFIRAIRAAVDADPLPGVQFLIVGDGDEHDRLAALADSLGVTDRLRFVGHRDDVEALLPLFDVFVISSHSEGFPLSLIEAMASGRAIVATEVGGIPEIIRSGDTGILVPASDPDSLGAAIVDVLRDPAQAAAMGARARVECESRYRLDAIVGEFIAIYEELAPAAARRRLTARS